MIEDNNNADPHCANHTAHIVTAEEEIAFELLEKRLADEARIAQINRMVGIASQCSTTSYRGVCTLLYDAGCRFGGEL